MQLLEIRAQTFAIKMQNVCARILFFIFIKIKIKFNFIPKHDHYFKWARVIIGIAHIVIRINKTNKYF